MGEAQDLPEAVQKSRQCMPDVIILDLQLEEACEQPAQLKTMLGRAKLLAITFGADENSKATAEQIRAEKLVDKINLVEELIPTILALGLHGQ